MQDPGGPDSQMLVNVCMVNHSIIGLIDFRVQHSVHLHKFCGSYLALCLWC